MTIQEIQELIKDVLRKYKANFTVKSVAVGGLSSILLLALALAGSLEIVVPTVAPPPEFVDGLKEIHDGKILFNPRQDMEQGKRERVEARISYQDVGDAITKGLKGRGQRQIETIQVGEKMGVPLYADKKEFDIKKYSSEEQLVSVDPLPNGNGT